MNKFSTCNFNIATWNVTGIMCSSSYLCDLLRVRSIDIAGVSEHWLNEKNVHFLNSIDTLYKSVAACSSKGDCYFSKNTAQGGVAIFWHRKIDHMVVPLSTDYDRIIGIQVELSPSQFIFIIQVYMPSSNHPMSYYRDTLDKLMDIWSM